MYFYFLSNIILDDNISLRQKISKLKENYIFYRRLQQLLKKGTIYHSLEDKKITNDFLGHLTKEDHNLIKKIFEKNVKEFLKLGNLKNSLTFEADDDFRQIGYGTMLLQKPVRSLWTTGKALFYLPFMKDDDNKFKLEFFSIPPITISVRFEGKDIEKVHLGTLSSKSLEFVVNKEDFRDNVCKIEIITNKLWLPHKLSKSDEVILIGVGIKSIANIT